MATDPNQLLGVLLGTVGQQGGILQGAQNNALDQQLGQQRLTLGGQQQTLNDQQIAQGQTDQDQQAQYGSDIQAWTAAGAPKEGLSTLIAKYPKQFQALQDSWKAKNADAAQSDIRTHGAVFNALDHGATDVAIAELQSRLEAETKAGHDTTELKQHLDELRAGNPAAIAAVKGWAQANLASAGAALGNPELVKAAGADYDGSRYKNTGAGNVFDTRTGTFIAATGGGDPASDGAGGGGSAPGGRDVSRLINTDAGGGYVPDSVKTLGQFVAFGKSLNAKGAKSSSAGTYQINGSTMAEFAPKALGAGWRDQPFDANAQDKVGEAIFDWAKAQPNPAAALKGRWVSLSADKAAQLVKGSWDQAKSTIAQGETGGAPGSSANAGAGDSARGVSGYTGAAIENLAKMDKLPAGLPKEVRAAVENRKAALATTSGGAGGGLVGGLNNEAIDRAAYSFNKTGALPKNLRRGSGAAEAIINRAAQLAGGTSQGQLLGDQASFKADTTSLAQLEKNTGNILAFERTALRNGALAVRKSLAVDNGGVPAFNRWVNAGRRATGDGDVSAFDAAVSTFANEYAKVTSGANGVTSDTARAHAHELINSTQSPDQFFKVMQTLQEDMENRRRGLHAERHNILQRISGVPQQQPQPSASAPAGFRVLRVRPK